jgi:hypothetical protein
MAGQIFSAASSSTLGNFLRDLDANIHPPSKDRGRQVHGHREFVKANSGRSAGWSETSPREHQRPTLVLLASRRSLKSTKAEASAKLVPMRPSLKHSLIHAGAGSAKLYSKPEDFVFPCKRLQGIRPLDLALVLMLSLEQCWRRWANSNSRSVTTCGSPAYISRTNTCRRLRRPKG